MSYRRYGRPKERDPAPPKAAVCFRWDAALHERLNAFRAAGPVHLTRSALISLAVTRLLDALQDDPKNLFTK